MISLLLYFITPLLVAGVLHHLVVIPLHLFSSIAKPIDFGTGVLGKNKTWRGLLFIPIASGVSLHILSLFWNEGGIEFPFITGACLGIGYATGELPNSGIKRWKNISPGADSKTLWQGVIDHADSILGSLVALSFFYPFQLDLYLSLLILGSGLHFLIDRQLNRSGYKVHRSKSD